MSDDDYKHYLRISITPAQLLAVAQEVAERVPPHARLVRNGIRNLSIVVDGEFIGWVDLGFGRVSMGSDDEESGEPQ